MIYNIVDKNIFLTLLIVLNNEIGKYRELKDPERKKIEDIVGEIISMIMK